MSLRTFDVLGPHSNWKLGDDPHPPMVNIILGDHYRDDHEHILLTTTCTDPEEIRWQVAYLKEQLERAGAVAIATCTGIGSASAKT